MKSSIVNDFKVCFRRFAGGNEEMDNHQFSLTMKTCGIIDTDLSSRDVDIIFAKVKESSRRKITFPQFELALYMIAEQKGVDAEDIARTIFLSGGPKFTGTKTDYVKFHDDRSLYTGVYSRGGPSVIDSGKDRIIDLCELCDRSPADVRGRKKPKSRNSISGSSVYSNSGSFVGSRMIF